MKSTTVPKEETDKLDGLLKQKKTILEIRTYLTEYLKEGTYSKLVSDNKGEVDFNQQKIF